MTSWEGNRVPRVNRFSEHPAKPRSSAERRELVRRMAAAQRAKSRREAQKS
jgi:hypothetical protein